MHLKLKKLISESAKASKEFRILEDEVRSKRRSLLAEAAERIDEKLREEYGERLDALDKARREAESARLLGEVSEAIRLAPYPVGTKMIGWGNISRYLTDLKPMATGILEVVTRETKHPANRRYCKASVGSYIVRLLKKDGTLGIAYEILGGFGSMKWLPEGESPKQHKPR